MKEFGPLLGYSMEMEQKKSENPKGPHNPAALACLYAGALGDFHNHRLEGVVSLL